jgi:signal peptidase II
VALNTFKKIQKPLIIILLVLLADQILKIWVKTDFMLGESIPVAGNWFYLSFVENNGMAFGIEFGGEFGKLFLSLFRIVVVGFMTWFLFKSASKSTLHPGLVTSFSFIVAGAIGNIIDSAFYGLIFNDSFGQVATLFPPDGGYAGFLHGHVVDMFYFPIIDSTFPDWLPFWGGEHFVFFSPVFNLADASITTGAGIFLIYQKHFFNDKKKEELKEEA